MELWIPGTDPGALERRYPDVRLRRQRGADLGARMSSAFQTAFADGAERALIVGSDHPTVTSRMIEAVFDALDDAPAAFGPTLDGGYWAVGLRASVWPRARGLFEDVPWSTSEVLAVTRRKADAAGVALVQGPTWYDVDRPEDLERLREDLAADSATARALARLEERGA